VLTSIDSKALIDLRNLNACDQLGQCVTACPMDVISLEKATIPAKIAS
jgi:ferredoxin